MATVGITKDKHTLGKMVVETTNNRGEVVIIRVAAVDMGMEADLLRDQAVETRIQVQLEVDMVDRFNRLEVAVDYHLD
jgi:predicted CoA-binding protein